MTNILSNRRLAAGAAAAAAIVTFTALSEPVPAATVAVDDEHWDLAAEVDCAAKTVRLAAENHGSGAVQSLAETVFEVDAVSGDALEAADTMRFDPDPVRALSHDPAEAAPGGQLVVGFEVEHVNCGTSTPSVRFQAVSGSTVPTGGRAAAYKATQQTSTDIDTSSGTGLNGGVLT
ncbi:MAG: hypothetical protein ACLGIO_03330, partial [Acidimicrobiia bacterium]